MKRLVIVAGCAAISLVAAAVWAAEPPHLIRIDANQMRSGGIETASLPTASDGARRTLPALVVIPNAQIRVIAAPLAGLVQSLAVAPNDTVKRGQLLARLQSPMLIDAQREYLQAATQAQLAQSTFKRDEQLFKEGIVAEGRYLAAKAAYAQAAATMTQHTQLLRLYGMSEGAIGALQSGQGMRVTLDIAAPINGVVLEQMAATGQRVEASAPLYKLAQLSPLWLEMQATPAAAAGIVPGATVSAQGASGKVVSVGRHLGTNQTVTIRAEINQGADALRAGQYVEAAVASGRSGAKQWQIPLGALARQQGRAYVFVQTQAGFVPTEVQTLGETSGSVVVSGALRGDERIAVKGIAALKAAWTGIGEGE